MCTTWVIPCKEDPNINFDSQGRSEKPLFICHLEELNRGKKGKISNTNTL